MTTLPLPCPICERPAKRNGAAITCPHCGLTWADPFKDMPLDIALARYMVEGYHANLYRAETAALAGDMDGAFRCMYKALDYFGMIERTVTG